MPFPSPFTEQPSEPSDGGPVAVPSQDMVLGIYYLTQERPGVKGEGKFFKSVNEAILAYENQVITLHSRIKVRVSKTMPDGTVKSGNSRVHTGTVPLQRNHSAGSRIRG